MNTGKLIPIAGVIATVSLCVIMASGQIDRVPDGTFAGIISEIKCTGKEKKCKGQIIEASDSKAVDLIADRDKDRPLAVGDRIRCKDALRIVVNQGGKSLTIEKKDFQRIEPSDILKSILEYSDPAYTRFSAIPIFSPSVGGAERVRDIVLRWQPTPGMDRVTVNIWSVSTGKKICCDGEYDGRKGVLDLTELRTALSPLREGSEKDRELVLEVRASPLRVARAEFEVLSTTQEHELDAQLEEWQRKDKLLAHIGRAHVLLNFRLYSEAEQEWEAALAQEPSSPYLLSQALYAAQLVGNTSRAEELAARLKSSSK